MSPPDDDCHEPPIEHSPVAGGSKTFLKPFVKGVASAGRSVGAGIYHAGKVVDAITDLTERISLPRNAATPNLSAASHAEFGPPLDSSEVVTEERREKSRRFRAFKKGSSGPGNSSDAGSEGYISQPGLSRLDSLELSRDEFPPLDNHHMSRVRYSRAQTDHIGLFKCDDEEPEISFVKNSDDEINGPADRRDTVYNYEAVFPKSRSQSVCRMAFAKRRHTIQIPQDYNLFPVRHSIRKQNLEVQLVWKYRLLKKMEQEQRLVLEAFKVLEEQYDSTAKEAEIKSREVKDRLEGYVEQNKMATELLSFLPADPLMPSHSTTFSATSPEHHHQRHPPGDAFHHHYQQHQLSVSSRAFSWDKVDPQTWELFKQLTSSGEVLRQRRHEVSNKRRMMEHHVDELTKQAGLHRASSCRDDPSRRLPPKDPVAEEPEQPNKLLKKEKRKAGAIVAGGQYAEQEQDKEERGAESADAKLVVAMAEEVISTIERDPSLQVAEFIELVVVAGLSRLITSLAASLGSLLRAILRALLLFFVRQIHRVARYLDLDDHQLGLNHRPHSNLLVPPQSPHPSSSSDHSTSPEDPPRQ
ncbi:hypothetical protein PtA15_8A124 [Puccinia triticina]|uniref:Uncharacterized protein n=1 Tax=Puccinia triticina TaxID=208348 RepID=A0ABY7CS99_9BASI|nr:uncharacterized protein PtA15_8A124 [Puccinia triticina]WAQ87223.1 hypothetical protein PtA15_8A124 [Puccinia triticina]